MCADIANINHLHSPHQMRKCGLTSTCAECESTPMPAEGRNIDLYGKVLSAVSLASLLKNSVHRSVCVFFCSIEIDYMYILCSAKCFIHIYIYHVISNLLDEFDVKFIQNNKRTARANKAEI